MLICFVMKIRYFLVLVLLFVVGVVVGFVVRGGSLTGEVVRDLEEYSYTRAVCSEEECIDVVVFCEGERVVEIEPIFYLIEHEDGWGDPRGEDVSGFCD